MGIGTFLMLAEIVVAVALIAIVVVQGQTGAGLGAVFGGSDMYRTRRGVDKTLYQATFVLTAIFLVLSLVTVIVM